MRHKSDKRVGKLESDLGKPKSMKGEKETKLIRALQKDFNALYVKEFSTHWQEDRMIRGCELEVMSFKYTMRLLK